MQAAQLAHAEPAKTVAPAFVRDPIVIVGAGPVGMRLLRLLGQSEPDLPVMVFGDEPCDPYNRIQLSGLLAGSHNVQDLSLTGDLTAGGAKAACLVRARVESIDPQQRTITDAAGLRLRYSKLVLATGSRPYVPAVPGAALNHVYTFRDMSDAEKLAARRVQSKHTVVLGAGLLGVEAARGMQRHNTRVTLVDHNSHPMYRQLDESAGALLAEELTDRGVDLVLGSSLRMIVGTGAVEAVVLRDGTRIACDTVILATGIEPRIDLAREAGLAFGRGVTVNNRMQTSDPHIYAIGECCEFDGQVFGLVAPGYDQAKIAARNLLGDSDSRFRSPQLATSLKVAGMSIFSMGDPQPHSGMRSYTYSDGTIYRRITLVGGRLDSINAVGDWPELPSLRDLAETRRWISPLQLWRFRRSGQLFSEPAGTAVVNWSDSALVCNCNSVSCGELRAAISTGATNVDALTAATRAGSTCGSCQPLLRQLVGSTEPVPQSPGRRLLAAATAMAAVLALVAIGASVAYPDSVQLQWRWDSLWRDKWFKQVSGFTILGLTLVSLVFSLRKRIKSLQLGHFAWWRISHVVLTVVALVALGVHTGFRFGSNLNLALMVTFCGLAAAGALLSASIALEDRLSPSLALRLRSAGIWGHVIMAWPLPALLGVHVLKTYYF